MDENLLISIIGSLMALVLVGSGLRVRGEGQAKLIKLALIWLGIFTIAFILARYLA